jgi:hypothetical protein
MVKFSHFAKTCIGFGSLGDADGKWQGRPPETQCGGKVPEA